jgi:hypothetical protein
MVIVAALGGWALLGEPETQNRMGLRQNKGRVFPYFVAQEIVRIELTQGGTTVVLFRSQAGGTNDRNNPTAGWFLQSPISDAADDAQVNKILNAVQYLKFSAEIEGEDLAEYKFGEATIKANFMREGKAPFEFTLGSPRAGKVVPLRIESPEKTLHVEQGIADTLTQDLWLLRNKQLVALKRDLVLAATVERRTGADGPGETLSRVDLVLHEGRWRYGGEKGEFASRARVDQLLDAVCYFRALGIESDAPTPADLKRLGISPPVARVILTRPDATTGKATETLEIGEAPAGSPEERYVRLASRPTIVYRANITKLYESLERPAEDFLELNLFAMEGGAASIERLHVEFADGGEFKAARVENDWIFEGTTDPVQLCKGPQVEELLKTLLGLQVLERLGSSVDDAAHAFDSPELWIEVQQGERVSRLLVGNPLDGQPGVYSVKRVDKGDTQSFAYSIALADLPARLRDAPLELRDPTLFKASSWSVDRIEFRGVDGALLFGAEKKDPNKGQDVNPIAKWFVDGESRGTDDQRLVGFVKSFEDVLTERWVALDSTDARREYGLDAPRRLSFRLKTLGEGSEVVTAQRTLLLGQREGKLIYALRDGGPAIGLIDAAFIDRLQRGFAAETVLFKIHKWDVKGLKVWRGESLVLDLAKPDLNWVRSGKLVIDEPTEVEDLFEDLQRVGLSRSENATQARLAETGLAAPKWKIQVTSQSPAAKEATVNILEIGTSAAMGEGSRWAKSPGSAELGSWFDAPLRKIETYLKSHPMPANAGGD